ncbi:PREDICTED: LOW QUALITY PROTEIN: endogenous retrovirus group K member 9 Pol protein-like [Dipodomys ordii]|uniref:Protease n=1 Tax=Dipodomys ordii TaxID=10020 RepID=A0A1S3EN82_DIPOR|nr:PREDICTED: LOW QUALITY PROTEIN: endogenous retrovirus group K member 9 Pol protein-like [Dipodomys ordii]
MTTSLSKIVQGTNESYVQFVARLEAAEKILGSEDMDNVFVKQLALENANTACKAVLRGKAKTLDLNGMIKLCNDVDSFEHKISKSISLAIGARFQAQTQPPGKEVPRWSPHRLTSPEGLLLDYVLNAKEAVIGLEIADPRPMLMANPCLRSRETGYGPRHGALIITPEEGRVITESGEFGPPPPGMFFLIIGRASSSLQGLTVLPSIVDADYSGPLKFLVQASQGPLTIPAGQRIAQALPLPMIGQFPYKHSQRGTSAPGSSDIFWVHQPTESRPTLKLSLEGKPFLGLLDTGADATVIARKHWPDSWPLEPTTTHLKGIGQIQDTLQSSKILNWADLEGNTGTIKPFVVEGLPVDLWGRDIMTQMGVIMFSPNETVTNIMLKSGFLPGKGLGKHEQGINQPILPTPKRDKKGLGADLFFLRTTAPPALRADKITWKADDPVWIDQWSMPQKKVQAALQLVQEQLEQGHLEPSTSPWNTPIFVIKKKNGDWRLLQDLREVNKTMVPMGALQPGLPSPVAIPKEYFKIVIDIKNCFFSIPLHLVDCKRFAFSIPIVNHKGPNPRFQWRVLPQGMANSPTLCQKFVAQSIDPIRVQYPNAYIIHYMDDLLIAKKIQTCYPFLFLGFQLEPALIYAQKIQIRKDKLTCLNDFQKLLGDINWLHPYLKLTTGDLKPLFSILQGDSDPTSPRKLTPEAEKALIRIKEAILQQKIGDFDPSLTLYLIIFATYFVPTGLLWQQTMPLLWVHASASPPKVPPSYPLLVSQLIFSGLKTSVRYFGRDPDIIITPYSKEQINWLQQRQSEWTILCTGFQGKFDNHMPNDKLIQFLNVTPFIFLKKYFVKAHSGCPYCFY